MGAQVLGAASAGALTPHLTRSFITGGMDSVLHQYEHLTRRSTSVAIFVPFAMAATAFSAIPLWLGGGERQVVWVLLALLPGIAINASTGVCSSTLMAIGRPAITAYVTVFGGVFQTAFAAALCYAFGFAGIAVAFAIGVPVAKLIGVWYMQTSAGIPIKLYLRGVGGPYAVGMIATCLAFPIGVLAAPHGRESALWPFLGSAALFCATYATLGWSRDYLPRISLRRQKSGVSGRKNGRHRAPPGGWAK
jgi:O-antigen/teichoic acid export membrane protein